MQKTILAWLKHKIYTALPSCCVLCHCPTPHNRLLCAICFTQLPWIKHQCYRCSLPMLSSANELICGRCQRTPPAYDHSEVLWHYQAPITHLITQLKFHHKLHLSRLFGESLAQHINTSYQNKPLPTLLLPMPLHSSRLRERGFNQALEIARYLREILTIDIDYDSATRIRATQPQSSLPASQRQANVKNAFALTGVITASHVAVVDDVITTGHTMNEFCKLLRKNKVVQIDVWACARTSSSK